MTENESLRALLRDAIKEMTQAVAMLDHSREQALQAGRDADRAALRVEVARSKLERIEELLGEEPDGEKENDK